MRLIDADELCNELSTVCDDKYDRTVEWCIGILRQAPTIDAVEVVRCKDCKHWKGNDEPVPWNDGKIFIEVPCETKPTDFCSMGERKTDDD